MESHTKQAATTELGEKTRVAEGSNSVSPAFERHFTVRELAALWNLSEDTVRRCFQREDDVIEIVGRRKVSKRRYSTLRIPESVALRVHRSLSLVMYLLYRYYARLMLTIYRRHQKDCEHRAQGRSYRRCRCMIWADGTVGVMEIRKFLHTRNWQKAQDIVRQWEVDGQRLEEAQPITVKEACEKFMADAEARGLREPTLYKYRLLFHRLQDFAAHQGIKCLCECNLDCLRRFRGTWPNRNIAARKKLEALRAFFRFCWESDWIPSNPAIKLKPPKITDPPTMPFSREEVTQILSA
jgi:hypothetical protein